MYIDVISRTDHCKTHAIIKERYKYIRLTNVSLKPTKLPTLPK